MSRYVVVEQQQVRVLGQGHGDPHPLPLTAGELVHRPVGEVGGVGVFQRLGDGPLVGLRPLLPPLLVRLAASGDEVGDSDAVRWGRGLRQDADGPRDLSAGDAGEFGAVQQYGAPARFEEASQRPQDGGLAAGVGADDDRDLAVGYLEVQALDDGAVLVRQGQVVRREAADGRTAHAEIPPERLRVRMMSHIRYGAPTAAVRTPTGSSIGENMRRASRSATTTTSAPVNAEDSSGT